MALRPGLTFLGLLIVACSPSAREPVARGPVAAPPISASRPDASTVPSASVEAPTDSARGAASVAAPTPTEAPSDGPTSPPGPDPLESKEAERATMAVLALPGVKGLCAESIARGAASCTAWATEAPTGPCANNKVSYDNRECWWSVGLFELMSYPGGGGDHANRTATFYVEPKGLSVVAASRFECADLLFTLAAYQRLERAKHSGRPLSDDESCAGAIPYPIRDAQP